MKEINANGSTKNYHLCSRFQSTQKLVVSRSCPAVDGRKMHKDLKRTCKAIVILLKLARRSRYRRSGDLLNSPLTQLKTALAA